jgi:coenzyme PQQ precursor peptide PqqA
VRVSPQEEVAMKKVWSKPEVTEQDVGLEVTSYSPAEIGR